MYSLQDTLSTNAVLFCRLFSKNVTIRVSVSTTWYPIISCSVRAGLSTGARGGGRTTIMEFQPDICKDWKETGTCSFGDECIYLHDRGTYLEGWNAGKDGDHHNAEDVRSEDGPTSQAPRLPFACFLCRSKFLALVAKDTQRRFVVTPCNHYFCEECVLAHTTQDATQYGKCPQCDRRIGAAYADAQRLVTRLRASTVPAEPWSNQ